MIIKISKTNTYNPYFLFAKVGHKKNTSESELGFNNDSQVFDSIEGQQYYKLESLVHECGA